MTPTTIDYLRVGQIIERFGALDVCEAYYAKDSIHMRCVGEVVPDTGDMLWRAFAHAYCALDIGCGDGRRLLDNAERLRQGVGIDESPAMIGQARRSRSAAGIENLEFQVAKAAELPFIDAMFDMVFSERGPLGHSDVTLAEALRVLQPGGLLFVETLGDYDILAVERERFLRHGVEIQTLAAKEQTLVFESFYEYLAYRCSVWIYSGEPLPSPDDHDRFDTMLQEAMRDDGTISEPYRTIWIAGRKPAESVQ